MIDFSIFVSMKLSTIFLLLGILFLTTACPGVRSKSNSKKLEENNQNFPDLERFHFEDISFMKPEMFEKEYADNYILSDVYETFSAYDIYIHLSVELFDKEQISIIQYAQDNTQKDLDAMHSHYIDRRANSLYDANISIKKEMPKSVGFKGYIQVVHGKSNEYDELISYFIATIQVKDQFYVFQLIGKKNNMGYLYDDFINLLSSIES